MKRVLSWAILIMVALFVVACSTATPEVITVEKEVVVEKEKIVTVEVEKAVTVEVEKAIEVEKVVKETVVVEKEKVVEKEVVVTATSAPPTSEPAAPTEKQMGGTLSVWLPDSPPEISWLHQNHWQSGWYDSAMAETLFEIAPDGMKPVLATGYEASDDGLTYTVHLREGVTFHDGSPMTAEDVEFVLLAIAHPDFQPAHWFTQRYGIMVDGVAEYNAGEADAIEGIEIIDDYTIAFTLVSPNAAFSTLFLTNYPPICPRAALEALDWDSLMQGTAEYWYTQPIGTGPYKFVTYETDQYVEMERNEDYWGGQVGPEKLLLKISSAEVAMVMLEKGDLDLMNSIPLSEIGRLEELAGIEVLEAENPISNWYALAPNSYASDGFWRNPKALQALYYGLNREAYVKTILQGRAMLPNSMWDGTVYACPTMTEYNYDPEKAMALFDEIGLTADKRAEMSLELVAWTGLKNRQDFLPIAQESLRQLGFKVNVDIVDSSVWGAYRDGEGPRGTEWDFAIQSLGAGVDPGGADAYLRSTSPQNAARFHYPFKDKSVESMPWMYGSPGNRRAARQDQARDRLESTRGIRAGIGLHLQ